MWKSSKILETTKAGLQTINQKAKSQVATKIFQRMRNCAGHKHHRLVIEVIIILNDHQYLSLRGHRDSGPIQVALYC